MLDLRFNLSRFVPNKAIEARRTAAAGAVYRFGEKVMADAKPLVPVDTGDLRSTGHVQPPTIEGNTITVRLGFGGPAAPYAEMVHEDLTAAHVTGQAKYLETPMMQNKGSFAAYVAAAIRSVGGGQ